MTLGVRKIVETYDVAMNARSLRSTSRVFPREVKAWAMMAVDEADTPQAHPNGIPDAAVAALRRLKLPEMPEAREIRLEPTLALLDLHMAQTKNKALQPPLSAESAALGCWRRWLLSPKG